ncbi:MAG: hypothetical protein ACFB50_13535 [Rubrobacteraceae bacterium]
MRLGLVVTLMLVALLAGCGSSDTGQDGAAQEDGGETSVENREVTEKVTVERTTEPEDPAPETAGSGTTLPEDEAAATNLGGGATDEKLPGPAVPTETDIKRTVGETATLDNGNSVTVFSGELGVPPQESVYEARAGMDFYIIEAEVCVSGSNMEPEYFTPREFSLLNADTVRRMASVPTKLPALRGSDVEPGECNRGYITFQVDEGEEPQRVVFEGSSAVEWDLED